MAQKSKRQKHWHRGWLSETFSMWWLRICGYKILARRFKARRGEVDLIAKRGNTIVFVEVKFRKDRASGLWSITPRQQQRIAAAAEEFLQKHPHLQSCLMRFDAIIVKPFRPPYHMKGAWRLT